MDHAPFSELHTNKSPSCRILHQKSMDTMCFSTNRPMGKKHRVLNIKLLNIDGNLNTCFNRPGCWRWSVLYKFSAD